MIAQVAQTYSISPLQAAREIDEDPEQLAIVCLPLLAYARAKGAFDAAKGNPDKLQAYEGSRMMALVEEHTFDRKVRKRGR